jgi:excisionase family DNA binding protein
MALLTPAELAETLHVSVGHVYRLVSQRRVPFVKLGGSIRFRWESIERWIMRQEVVSVSQATMRGNIANNLLE